MKLTETTQQIIKKGLDLCTALDIESIIIDRKSMRGQNKDLGVHIIMSMTNYNLEVDAIGIGRTKLLKNRLQNFNATDIDIDTFDGEELQYASMFKFKSGKTKLSFKCQHPKYIVAASGINDPIIYTFNISDEDLQKIINGISMMGAETIQFSIENDESMCVNISDISGDMYKHESSCIISKLDDTISGINKTYKSSVLKTLLTEFIKKDKSDTIKLSITKRGVLILIVFDVTIYVFPER